MAFLMNLYQLMRSYLNNFNIKQLTKPDFILIAKQNAIINSKRDKNKIPFRIDSRTVLIIDKNKLNYYEEKYGRTGNISY